MDGKSPTVTFIELENKVRIAAFANEKWNGDDNNVRDSKCTLLNLTNRYNVTARNHPFGGIFCDSVRGPSFG